MKCYPVDSVVTELGSDGLPVYDRPYTAKDLREVYRRFFTDGVFGDPADGLQVSPATGGMYVTARPGYCMVRGCYGQEDEERTLQLQSASGSDRIDTVVARLDLSMEARSIDLYVLTGTPAASPVRPDLTRNDTVWELGLADVYVAAGSDSVSAARISDTRLDTSRCGIVSPFMELKTSSYDAQLRAVVQQAAQAYRDAISGTLAGKLQTEKAGLVAETTVASGQDLDALFTAGTYSIPSGTQVENGPGGFGVLHVYAVGGLGVQEFRSYADGRLSVWTRALAASVGEWGEWRRAVDYDAGHSGPFLDIVGVTVSEDAAPATGTPGTVHIQML